MANRVWSDEEAKVLADRIKILRRMLGLTQVEFAEQVGVSKSNVSKVEQEETKTSRRLVRRIELTYRIDISEDLDDSDWSPREDVILKALPDHMIGEQEALPPITRRIFDLLKKRNITQRELADSIGVSFATISAWKQRRRTPYADRILPICKALNVTPYYLLSGKDEGVSYPEEMM